MHTMRFLAPYHHYLYKTSYDKTIYYTGIWLCWYAWYAHTGLGIGWYALVVLRI